MNAMTKFLLVPAAVFAAACGGDEKKTDDALKNDLALAAQAQAYQPQQFTSPSEMGYAYNPYTGRFEPIAQSQAQAPVVQRVATRPASTVRRTSTARSSGTRVVYQPAPEPQIKRNTKRDAVIGAAAGAVIGATVSRDKVKGGLIGAAAGAVLGGIVGHTIDVERKPN